MDKKKLFTIGEFSKLTGVSIHSLRYYDEIGALTPEYVDPLSNYRYYSFAQLSRLFAINICISSGIRLNELNCFIRNDSVDYSKLLEGSRNSIDSRIDEFIASKSSLERIEKLLGIRDAVMSGNETVIHLDDFAVWAVPHTIKSCGAGDNAAVSDSDLLIGLSSQARKSGVNISPMCFGIIKRRNENALYKFAMLAKNSTAGVDAAQLIRIPEGDYLIRRSSGITADFDNDNGAENAGESARILISCAIICDDPVGSIHCTISSISE